MPKYNGHKNWNHWNVSLWINNDEGLYNMARDAANWQTPDGAPYTVSSVMAAMRGM